MCHLPFQTANTNEGGIGRFVKRRLYQHCCFCGSTLEYWRARRHAFFSDWWRSKLGTQISLTASDGFKLGGYRADPPGSPKGGLVVIQEIFGVNHHIRSVCDRFAALGYASVAPAVFDRMSPTFSSGYSPAP